MTRLGGHNSCPPRRDRHSEGHGEQQSAPQGVTTTRRGRVFCLRLGLTVPTPSSGSSFNSLESAGGAGRYSWFFSLGSNVFCNLSASGLTGGLTSPFAPLESL